MNILKRIIHTTKQKNSETEKNVEKTSDIDHFSAGNFPDFSNSTVKKYVDDPYLFNAWVNIAVGIVIRNVARANFTVVRSGNKITTGKLYALFNRPNKMMSCFDLWKETAAWWLLEGEAFWWFGNFYAGGIPNEIYVLDPRRMRHESEGTILDGKCGRWFYQSDTELIPILQDEIVHFREWNPWNPLRGVSPLVSFSLELEQDYYANRANSQLLKHNAVPQGILKTDQVIRPEEADALERRWEAKYGEARASRKIAVLGKGTEFKPLSFTPETVKLFELKRWIVYAILAKYGIPPKVANIQDKGSPLSGKDTAEQHAEFWKYTIVPLLKNFEDIIKTQFFMRLGLSEVGTFDLADIPELQESEDAQSNRDIAEINAGLKTINEVLKERGKDSKPWGDIWYRPRNMIPTAKGDEV
ncbi:phage portal protein [Treponema primitia]|uniref:phage portal protein n=1 Tax=Treponema primitia TaxID=88058 RepID=UPI0039801625